jgi:hypothetical protein
MLRAGKKAIIVQWCTASGKLATEVHEWNVSEPMPKKHFCRENGEWVFKPSFAVFVYFTKPMKREKYFYEVVPECRFLTIEQDGCIVYDSRLDVPCDMDAWLTRYKGHHPNLDAAISVPPLLSC